MGRRFANLFSAVVAVAALAGCSGSGVEGRGTELIALGEIETDRDGRCFARTAPPTQTEVVTELVEVEPARTDANGVVITPAIFRNITRPVTRPVGDGARFEAVCPQVYTAEMVETLQRALIVRRAYGGPVNGVLDAATRAAVRAFQLEDGLDSPVLAVRVAQDLGIVAVPRG